MDEVNVAIVVVWRCVDACCLLLGLLIRTISWLLCSLSSMCCSLHGALNALSGSGVTEYGNFALFSFLSATEAVSSAVHGALSAIEGWLQTLGGVLESTKMVGHLLCHMTWRAKEMLQRGFISGTGILRQTCDSLWIVLSLVVYFVNTVVNMFLLSTQNCVSMLVGLWEAVAAPVHKAAELTLTVLTFLYSCLVGVSVLLWTPCQLLLDFIAPVGRAVFTVVMADTYIVIAAAIVSMGLLMVNPRLLVVIRQPSFCIVNMLHRAQATIHRVYVVIQGQALSYQEIRNRTQQEMSGTMNAKLSQANPQKDCSSPLTEGELLSLLKEQEERKKCVICQDSSKTVLLLPCRHLCLCRRCAHILTQRRHVQQRCCPLCRQHITQTMDVFL